MKIKEIHMRIMKIMEIIEMHMGIQKIMKIIEIQCTNYENPKDLKTQVENH